MSEVNGLLATGSEESLQRFWRGIFLTCNYIDRRGQTIRVTCFDVHFGFAIESARACDVALQRIVGAGETETYELLHQGTSPGWGCGEPRQETVT